MNTWRTKASLVLVVLWPLVTVHCRLEVLPSLAFLTFFDHWETSPHQDDDCATDGCLLVEHGHYKPNDNLQVLHAQILDEAGAAKFANEPSTSVCWISFNGSRASPPGLAATWLFLVRAAPPPRSPSISA
ncbi:MAG: hypothetical protein O2960_18420 [Verrucomicrobia bacterium]|nr:hypothetical protein [Verrucomicrobiota bacterium]